MHGKLVLPTGKRMKYILAALLLLSLSATIMPSCYTNKSSFYTCEVCQKIFVDRFAAWLIHKREHEKKPQLDTELSKQEKKCVQQLIRLHQQQAAPVDKLHAAKRKRKDSDS